MTSKERKMTDMGMPSDKPCMVCGQVDENQTDSWFNHVVCKTHRWVPPAFIDKAKEQYKQTGKTKWDLKNE